MDDSDDATRATKKLKHARAASPAVKTKAAAKHEADDDTRRAKTPLKRAVKTKLPVAALPDWNAMAKSDFAKNKDFHLVGLWYKGIVDLAWMDLTKGMPTKETVSGFFVACLLRLAALLASAAASAAVYWAAAAA
jgi:hypothetical protein